MNSFRKTRENVIIRQHVSIKEMNLLLIHIYHKYQKLEKRTNEFVFPSCPSMKPP